MTKVVINQQSGGFTLSEKALLWLEKHGAFNTVYLKRDFIECKKWLREHDSIPNDMELGRDNPLLVKCVKTLKEQSYDSDYSKLIVVDVQGILGEDFYIDNIDGMENIVYYARKRKRKK